MYQFIFKSNSIQSTNSKDHKNLFMIFARMIGIYVELLESSESAKKTHTYICNAPSFNSDFLFVWWKGVMAAMYAQQFFVLNSWV